MCRPLQPPRPSFSPSFVCQFTSQAKYNRRCGTISRVFVDLQRDTQPRRGDEHTEAEERLGHSAVQLRPQRAALQVPRNR